MVEVRRTRFFSPKKDKGKIVLNEKGKPEMMRLMLRQAYIPDPVGIDGVRGYIVTCQARNSDHRLETVAEKSAEKIEDWKRDKPGAIPPHEVRKWARQQMTPTFSVSILRDSPPDTMMVKWAACPGGQLPKWGVSSQAMPLRLDKDTVHQTWFACEKDTGKVLGKAVDRKTLERKFPDAEYVYGYMEPLTIGGEKRLRTANEVTPDMVFLGERAFGNWAKHLVGGYANSLTLVQELMDKEASE